MFGIFESIIDNVVRDKVPYPEVGSVVYCDLAFGYAEHSGIYVGGGEIIHFNRDGMVECVSPEEFLEGTTAISIYVSCRNGRAVGDELVADRARRYMKHRKEYKGYLKEYSLLTNNCHMFTSTCISGDMDHIDTFLWFLKGVAEKELRVNEWRVWDRTPKWGALARSKSTGKMAYSWGAESSQDARRIALKNAPEDSEIIVRAGGSKWIAVAAIGGKLGYDSDFSKKRACQKAKEAIGDSDAKIVLCFSTEDGFNYQPD